MDESSTRAKRRARTIEVLLDATIESLATVGFVATTTRSVAERAGVSQGAQQHYFPSKAALVDAAMNRFADQALTQASQLTLEAPSERDRAALFVDGVWETYHLPMAAVISEILNLARTHPETAQKAAATLVSITERTLKVAAAAMPTFAEAPDFRSNVLSLVAAVRDTGLVSRIPGAEGVVPDRTALAAAFLRAVDPGPA